MAIAAFFGVCALVVSGDRAIGGATGTQHAQIGDWGVDLTARNTAIKPGDDFYHYANGAWLDTFEIPADLSSYGSFTILTLRGEEQIKGIIEEQAKARSDEITVGWKIGELYNEFIDQDALNAKGLTPLDAYLKMIAASKSLDEIAALTGELTRTNGGGPGGGGNTPSRSTSTR
jgi:putative endopeptidase